MTSRSFSMHDEPEFLAVLDLLRNSDFTYAHLEMNFGNYDELEWPARGDWTASYMMADPRLAAELKWAGISITSLAHNHSFDFGAAGLLSTIRHCREAGLTVAGTGSDLEEAREPAYMETKRGRVALISTSSGNKSYEWAGMPKASLRGRPGVNPLRVSMKYQVDAEAARQLKRIAEALKIGGERKSKDGSEVRINLPGDQSTLNAGVFVPGTEFKVISECNRRDFEGNLRSIDEAMKMADFVMVAHHFNIAEGSRGDVPPNFARIFAKAAIDAGADIYIGHGWHKTLGIEIYKGKPIFYGMGNFFAQSEFIQRVPYDSYESWQHDVDKLPTLNPGVYPLHPGMDSPTWWNSAVISLAYDNNALREIKMYPVEMGRNASADSSIVRSTGNGPHAFTEGRPLKATGENARLVLERLQRLAALYGTRVEIEGEVGIIRLPTGA